MKTNLFQPITNVTEAKAYLTELFNNDESFHPEDDATDIIWEGDIAPTEEEINLLNSNHEKIYEFESAEFCPCGFLCELLAAANGDIFDDGL